MHVINDFSKLELRLQRCNLLSFESHRIERDMHTVFKLMHGLNGITLEDPGPSLCTSIKCGGSVRPKQGHVINNTISPIYLNTEHGSNGTA